MKCTLSIFYNKDLLSNEKEFISTLSHQGRRKKGCHSISAPCSLSASPKEIGGKTEKYL